VNAAFATDVAAFRATVESVGITFLEAKEPLAAPAK
jgi:hypothetical protein